MAGGGGREAVPDHYTPPGGTHDYERRAQVLNHAHPLASASQQDTAHEPDQSAVMPVDAQGSDASFCIEPLNRAAQAFP